MKNRICVGFFLSAIMLSQAPVSFAGKKSQTKKVDESFCKLPDMLQNLPKGVVEQIDVYLPESSLGALAQVNHQNQEQVEVHRLSEKKRQLCENISFHGSGLTDNGLIKLFTKAFLPVDADGNRIPNTFIKGLDLSKNYDLTVASLEFISQNFPQLEELNLSDNYFGDEIGPALRELTQLRNLNLSYTQITGGIMIHLSELKNLVTLDVSRNITVTDDGMPDLIGASKLRQLRTIGTSVGTKFAFTAVDFPDLDLEFFKKNTNWFEKTKKRFDSRYEQGILIKDRRDAVSRPLVAP